MTLCSSSRTSTTYEAQTELAGFHRGEAAKAEAESARALRVAAKINNLIS